MESYFHRFSNAITKCKSSKPIWPSVGAAACLASAAIMTGGTAAIFMSNDIPEFGFLFFALAILATAGMLAACLRIALRI